MPQIERRMQIGTSKARAMRHERHAKRVMTAKSQEKVMNAEKSLTEQVFLGRLRVLQSRSYFSSLFSPGMTDERQGGRFQSLNRDHEDAPSDSIENSPRSGIVGAHRHNPMDEPEVDGVPQC
jgi:hypothetical protein